MTEPAKKQYTSPVEPQVIGHAGHAENDPVDRGGIDASFDYESAAG